MPPTPQLADQVRELERLRYIRTMRADRGHRTSLTDAYIAKLERDVEEAYQDLELR